MSIVTYKGKEWSLLELTNEYLTKPPLIDRGVSTACYPSSASCWVQDGPNKYLEGGCNRSTYYRMIGEPATNPPGEYSYYINEHGKFIEEFLIDKWTRMGLWVANNIKFYVPETDPRYGFPLSGEIDCFVRTPGTTDTKDVILAEIKSYYKWFKKRELLGTKEEPGKPAYNNLFQLMLYLDFYKSIGIEKGKLLYTSRDEACQVEFDIRLKQINGYTHALVNGVPDMTFSLEGVIARYKEVWDAFKKKEMPPRDFQLVYSAEKMEDMYRNGAISKSKYDGFQKGRDAGDWQCLAEDSKVLTDKGWLSIKDVNISNRVLTRNGWKKVLRAEKVGTKKTVTLMTNVFSPLELTPDHRILVSTISEKRSHVSRESAPLSKYKYDIINGFEFKEVQELDFSKYNYMMMPIDIRIDSEVEEYWNNCSNVDERLEMLAAYVSDGSIESETGIAISFGASEIDKAKQLFSKIAKIGFNGKVETGCHGIRIRSRKGADKTNEWIKNNIFKFICYEGPDKKSHAKCLSRFLTEAPLDIQFKFIEFLHQYDGCVTTMRSKPVWAFTTTSHTLALQVQHMYFRSGIIAGVSKIYKKATNYCASPKSLYMLAYYPEASFNYGFIYNNTVYQQISTVDVGSEAVAVYDITVEDEEEFVTSAGIVHNCSFCNYKDLCWDIQPNCLFIN